jgi:predicted phage terminase large subunit-like protein
VRAEAQRFNWLAAGRRWRKTSLCMTIAVEAALKGQRVMWGAPVFDQVRIGWDEARRACGEVALLNQSRMSMTFPGGGAILFRSLDNPDNARGHSADGVVMDECGDIKAEAWYEVLRPMLIDTGGWAWGIGTPRGRNWFWHEHQQANLRSDSISWQIPTLGALFEGGTLVRRPHPMENPFIPFSEVLELSHSPENTFRQEILAEFVEAATQTFALSWWDETPEHPARRFAADDPRLRAQTVARWISWDTGFKDTDNSAYTACVVGELTADYRLLVREVWRDQLTFPNLVDQITRVAERYAQDYTGTGEGGGQRRLLRAVVIEDKASGISAVQTLRETAPPWLADLIVPFQPQGSKEQRASLAAVWCKDGCVWLPHPSEDVRWLADFQAELAAFPSGAFLDQVDALSQLVLYVSRYLSQGRTARLAAAQQLAAPANGLAA